MIINKNKNNLKPIAIIVLTLGIIYLLGFKFLRYPAEHTYFLLPTKKIVMTFSIIGITFCLLAIFIILKNIFRKNAFLKIYEQGIYDGFSFYSNKFIQWNEINRIETIHYNRNNYIAIFAKKTQNKEKGINRLFYKMNELFMGTPYIISAGYLDCSFNELEKVINDAFLKHKK